MSGIMALRNAARRSPTAFNMLRATYSTTNISGGSMGKAWSDKEHAAESQYFNQQDAKMLEKLAKKLQTQTTVRIHT